MIKTNLFHMMSSESILKNEVLTLVQIEETNRGSTMRSDGDPFDDSIRGTTTIVQNDDMNGSNASVSLIYEYCLEMRQIEKRNRAQVWFYRYDCIVNSAYPHIAL